MLHFIKRDFLLTWSSWALITLLLIPVGYITYIPPTFILLLIFSSVLFGSFFYDQKATIHRTNISLPLRRTAIVMSRYVFFLLFTVIVVLLQWGVISMMDAWIPTPNYYVYGFKDFITVTCLFLLLIAVFAPMYYLIRNPHITFSVYLIILFLLQFILLSLLTDVLGMTNYVSFNEIDQGFVLLVEKYIPFQPYLILVILSIGLYIVSLKISEKIFSKQSH
ncbi:hypothetical protein D8M04_05960 [Oceanobacillus piezotolerans]|uniref:Uncharacterized protein n=1 Tax=Oceanobacillus piezotolerans TaxID=2448030 RepID=A0A498D890_9BACI|nr:ABC-2 transporter permease [Oceanobacillus piezotolerans]RLL46746.1 hypothetical protein D8M04_05960 [Oceanobacillus piezotolerans]